MAFFSWKRGAKWPRELSCFYSPLSIIFNIAISLFSSLISRLSKPEVPVPSSPHLGDDASIVVARQDRFLPPQTLVSADRGQTVSSEPGTGTRYYFIVPIYSISLLEEIRKVRTAIA